MLLRPSFEPQLTESVRACATDPTDSRRIDANTYLASLNIVMTPICLDLITRFDDSDFLRYRAAAWLCIAATDPVHSPGRQSIQAADRQARVMTQANWTCRGFIRGL